MDYRSNCGQCHYFADNDLRDPLAAQIHLLAHAIEDLTKALNRGKKR